MSENGQMSVKETMEKIKVSNGRRRVKRWMTVACLLVVIIGVVIALNMRSSSKSISYETEKVKKGDLQITVTATGNLEATNQVEVGSELSGIITSVKVDFNTVVSKGQALAYLDDTKYKAAVLKARAEVASAEAKYQEALASKKSAQNSLKRYLKTRELTNGRLPSIENFEQAETTLLKYEAAEKAAEAAVEIAKASLKLNETDLEKTVIYSPINGVVLSRDVDEGQTVAASLQAPVLFTLAEDLKNMELQVDIDEADVGQVKEGQKASFTVDAYPDKTFKAEITQVRYGAETTDGVVTYKAVLKVKNPELLLRPGMTATAEIVVKNIENSLLIPNSALLFSSSVQTTVKKEKRGFIRSLMPGPPRRRSTTPNRAAAETMQKGSAVMGKVWVLSENGQPSQVTVKRLSTDGAISAVNSEEIQEGTPVITSEIINTK
jgi:HlyD family secretion protein